MGLQTPVTAVAGFTTSPHRAGLDHHADLAVRAGLLVAIVVKFNEKANPVASRTTHHTGLEVAWTIVPVLILVAIAIPSFRLLKLPGRAPEGPT